MPKLQKAITIKAPVEQVFAYIDAPAHLPEIWPSLFEVKDVKVLPEGGHKFIWFYNLAGRKIEGMTETHERVPLERIVDRAKGDLESTFTWTFHGENGTTKVGFEADYELPEQLFQGTEKAFVMRRNEYEADTLLANLKAKLEV